jgi:hypothetical protein
MNELQEVDELLEEPRKKRLKERCAQAVDAAGYQLIEPPGKLVLPPELGLQGGIVPDVQSLDSDGLQYNYYVRHGQVGGKAIPGWLANLARATTSLEHVIVYVVTEQTGIELEASCRAAGAGLLVLREDLTFHHVINPIDSRPGMLSRRFIERIQHARRALENRLELELSTLQASYEQAKKVTSRWKGAQRAKYLKNIEEIALRWKEWAARLGERLDAVTSTADNEELQRIEQDIDAGLQ